MRVFSQLAFQLVSSSAFVCARTDLLTSAAWGKGCPFPKPLSVGDVLVCDDLLRCYPHQRLTLHRVAPAVLLGPIVAHVAAADARCPVEEVGVFGSKFCRAFDQDEAERRLFVVDAEADAGITAHVASLHRVLSGREYQRIAIQVEPDRGDVGTAVGPYRGEDRRPGAV